VRKSFILSIYGLIGLLTTAPVLSAILATLVAHLAGAQLSEAQVHPCVVLGVDLGPLLCGMFVFSWLGVVTLPMGLTAAMAFTFLVVVDRLRQASTGSGSR
jgi:hypothetical protein